MRTLRWATALSTVNCWLSEVIRLTWVAMAVLRSNAREGGAICPVGVVESKFESASLVGPFIPVSFHLPLLSNWPPLHMSFFGLSSALFRVSPPHFSIIKTDSCAADRASQPAKLFENALGQVRTATKRAGGVTRNHGGSAGRRLGVKKFTGEAPI